MEDFIKKAQSMQEKPIDEFSVKRCILHSPSQHPSKRPHQTNGTPGLAKQFFRATEATVPTRTLEAEAPMNTQTGTQQQALLLPKPTSEAELCSFTPQSLLTERQQQMITRALSSRDAVVLAAIIKEHCPSVMNATQTLLCEDIRKSCENLCRRSQAGSVLYGKDYESLRDFDFYKVWDELKANQPFIVELMNAVTDNDDDIEGTKHELRVKYSFLYSILMNERWHELSLIKRMNTVLIIEGGCSKQVLS